MFEDKPVEETREYSDDAQTVSPAAIKNMIDDRWHRLRELYLPVESADSIWRLSRPPDTNQPSQGWKLHLSATIFEACDLLEKVAPRLMAEKILFKAPHSIEELMKINSGLHYGYQQIGKFMTIYPSAEQAVGIAAELHDLTLNFTPIVIPFDRQYLPGSSVFYRYGAFENLEMIAESGKTVSAIRDKQNKLIYDDRFQPVPDWVVNPFPAAQTERREDQSSLTETYRVFRAITQRGKGGTYQALDLSVDPPRFCIVKEGRKNGELNWNGDDGCRLVKNEFQVLQALNEVCPETPKVYSFFELNENAYLAMEFVEGATLSDLMKARKRRFSVKQILIFAIGIAEIINAVHRAGWIWNDCKPANLIVTKNKTLRPIDFEGSYRIGQSDPFEWKTGFFSARNFNRSDSRFNDFYSLGAVLYFLLTGKIYDTEKPVPIANSRHRAPQKLRQTVEDLLAGRTTETAVANLEKSFKKILNETKGCVINSRTF